MVDYMNRLINKINNIFSLKELSPDFLRFSLLHSLFLSFILIQSFFINTLLFRLTSDKSIVALYNVLTWFFVAFFMTIAVIVVKKTSLRFIFIISIIFYIIMYIFFLNFMSELNDHILLISLLFSVGGGFYWIGFSYSLLSLNSESQKPLALAWLGIIATIVNLIIPTFAGYIISLFDGISGYYVIFFIALVFAVLSIITAITMPKIQYDDKRTKFRSAFSEIKRNKSLSFSLLGEFTRAIREGAFMFLLNILLFEIIQNEFIIGLNVLICSIITLVAQWQTARITYKFKYHKIINFSTTVLVVSLFLLLFNFSPTTIILISVVNGFFNAFLINPSMNIFFSAVAAADSDNNIRFEVISFREYLLFAGRALGILIVFSMPATPQGYTLGMIILTASQYLMSFIYTKAKKYINHK